MRYLSSILVLILCFVLQSKAQYPPAAGQVGSTAIHADSSCFIDWANKVSIYRGYVNMADTNFSFDGSNRATYGHENDATGKADNIVVSLGDKGFAILEFNVPIINGPSWDFAVFENSLNDNFLELAFVEVSSNGTDFFRFPSFSLTQTDTQTGTFGNTEPTKIHNLAGKYRQMFGTPFNLDDIADNPLLDKMNITHVKIIDVGGSINPLFASYDSEGRIINDPFPTPFNSSGFDLDAVGVINNINTIICKTPVLNAFRIYPNPASDKIFIQNSCNNEFEFEIFNTTSQLVLKGEYSSEGIDVHSFKQGIYFIKIQAYDLENRILKFIKK